jgi:hypothetical protein
MIGGDDNSLEISKRLPEAFCTTQRSLNLKIAVLVAVAGFLVEPAELLVSADGADLALILSDESNCLVLSAS